MAAPDAEALAADIICSLRGADLAGWTPPWCKPAPSPAPHAEGELVWPAVARGKRSRRSSPSAGTASGKKRWGRGSPASPLDYSGGSGSGASTSGGEDGGFCWPPATNKVGSIGQPHLTFPTPLPPPNGQRPRKKLKLPEVQQLVRSLEVENESLRQEMRALQRACTALSKEHDKLETKLERSNSHNENASKAYKEEKHPVVQTPRDSFVLPDLNLPPQDTAGLSQFIDCSKTCNFVS